MEKAKIKISENERPALSVVIPAHNEEGCIASTVKTLAQHLAAATIDAEILVVNDHSTDRTEAILHDLQQEIASLRVINNDYPNGFGFAIRKGLDNFSGKVVAIFMADASDSPTDLCQYYNILNSEAVDCVFGSRFIPGSKVYDYPPVKLILNRLANAFIRLLFGFRFNDTTNAFKMYRADVIEGLRPFLSHHFNLTVELPLKAITRGYSYAVAPISWTNRKTGVSKLKIREMGSRYLFIVLYCLIEKWLSCGDYRKN